MTYETFGPGQGWSRARRPEIVAELLADAQRAAGAGIGGDIARGGANARNDVDFEFRLLEQDVAACPPAAFEGQAECRLVVQLVGPAHRRRVVDQPVEVVLDELAARRRPDHAGIELQNV